MKKKKAGKTYFAPDGKAVGIRYKKVFGVRNEVHREGTWQASVNALCLSWGGCRTIEPDGNGGYFKVKEGSTRVVHFTKIEDGNTL